MATNAITTVKNSTGDVFVRLYRHYDGDVESHGKELYEFAKDFNITNGLSANNQDVKTANGAGCFAAQLVSHFKTEAGQFYLCPTHDTQPREYNYTITIPGNGDEATILINMWGQGHLYFGPLKDMKDVL